MANKYFRCLELPHFWRVNSVMKLIDVHPVGICWGEEWNGWLIGRFVFKDLSHKNGCVLCGVLSLMMK